MTGFGNLHWVELIGHLGYVLTLAAYLVSDMIRLRVLVALASAVMLFYFAFATGNVSWTPLIWMAIFLAVNLVWVVVLLRQQRAIRFTEEERELHDTLFRELSALEFLKLLRAGRWESVSTGTVLTREGETVEDLVLLVEGTAEVQRNRREPVQVRSGALIGEMSFIEHRPATATVSTTLPSRLLVWNQARLNDLFRRNPSMRAPVMSVIGQDLSRKLAVHS